MLESACLGCHALIYFKSRELLLDTWTRKSQEIRIVEGLAIKYGYGNIINPMQSLNLRKQIGSVVGI